MDLVFEQFWKKRIQGQFFFALPSHLHLGLHNAVFRNT